MGTLVFLETHDGEPTKGSLGVLGKGLAPVHRKAVANAKRLGRTKLR